MSYGQENQILENKPSLIVGGNVSFVEKTIAANAAPIPYGTVLGERADGKLVPCESANTDGSEIPLFIVFQEQGIDTTKSERKASVLSSGMIIGDFIVFNKAGDNMNTVVGKLSMANHLRAKFILQTIEGYGYNPEV